MSVIQKESEKAYSDIDPFFMRFSKVNDNSGKQHLC